METYSDFWIDDIDVPSYSDESEGDSFDINLIKLANSKRAISNFVHILTNSQIQVLFNTKEKNATDGRVVYLSADIKEKSDFDIAVGLALHEGSHVLLSDFEILVTLWGRIPRYLYDISEKKGLNKEHVLILLKTILNYIEDRFVDQYVYNMAPGYRGYYISMYNEFWNSDSISTGLESQLYRTPSIDSYLYRIINLTNPSTDLSALPDLNKVHGLIGLDNILRLKTPRDRLLLADTITEIVLRNICETQYKKEPSVSSPSGTPSSDNSSGNEPVGKTDKTPDSNKSVEDVIGGNSDSSSVEKSAENISKYVDNIGTDDSLTKSKLNKIEKGFEKQKEFLSGEVYKKKLTRQEETTISAIEQSGMTLVRVGSDLINGNNYRGIECIMVKKLTRELLFSSEFPLASGEASVYNISKQKTVDKTMENSIHCGIRLGKILGNRLQLRRDIRNTKFMRKTSGKIDSRTISELGFDSENIFYSNQVDKYNKSILHISVDASSSMRGEKWYNTMTAVVAICKAASMIDNLEVSVSLRTTVISMKGKTNPYVIIIYDSKVDKFNKIPNYFSHLRPNNTTPEGLSFEALIDNLPNRSSDEEGYFLNFSDGMPYFSSTVDGFELNYFNTLAHNHTKKQVSFIRNKGYKILSYFITDTPDNVDLSNKKNESYLKIRNAFKTMYGKDASFVNVNNIVEISKTMNALFLRKND